MSEWLTRHDGLVALIQLLVWAVTLGLASPSLRASWSSLGRRAAGALVGAALTGVAISAFVLPAFVRFVPLGHEASYAECFLGDASPSSAHGWEPYITYPMLRWLYWGLGALVGREHIEVLQIVNLGARGAAMVGVGLLGAALLRSAPAGVAAAWVLALHPSHAFWGSGIYNVSIPFALMVLCALLAVLAWRDGEPMVLAAAAATGGLVLATRVEWGLLAPALAILLVGGLGPRWGRSPAVLRGRFWGPAATIGVITGAIVALGAGELTSQGGYHDASGYLETMLRQVVILDFLEPLQRPGALALIVFGLWAAGARPGARRALLGLLCFAVLTHFAISTFNDVAYRHALLPGLALTLLVGAGLGAGLDGWRAGARGRAAVAGLAGLWLLGSTATTLGTLSERYYADGDQFEARHPGFSRPAVSPAFVEGGCYLITENERLWALGAAGSHFNLMEPGEAAQHWADHDGCILWLSDLSEFRADGLAVRARAKKLEAWFEWELLGPVRFDDGHVAIVSRMTAPPFGLTAPPAGWRWAPARQGVGGGVESP